MAAFARQGAQTAIVDLDLCFGDLTAALGAGEEARSIAQLAPLATEPSFADVVWSHPEGLRAAFAPAPDEETEARDAQDVVTALAAERGGRRTAPASGPRRPRAVGVRIRRPDRRAALARRPLFRAATRALAVLGDDDGVGLNRSARAEITPGDVVRVFGRERPAVLSTDRGITFAQDHGRLLPRRGRTGRAPDRLARRCLDEDT
ncbi:MAG: hypothetical protein H0W82_00805 [Actinobacteria bacterium]|nr:hypothetical protein [Actinomycetota bacterium]